MNGIISNERSIPMTRWSTFDQRVRDALALPPLNQVLTDGERIEVGRLGRFVVGQRVRDETVRWLDSTYRIARKEYKRRRGSRDAHDKWAEKLP